MFSVIEVIAFELFAVVSPIYDRNTCELQSTCYQTLPNILDVTNGDVFQLNLF